MQPQKWKHCFLQCDIYLRNLFTLFSSFCSSLQFRLTVWLKTFILCVIASCFRTSCDRAAFSGLQPNKGEVAAYGPALASLNCANTNRTSYTNLCRSENRPSLSWSEGSETARGWTLSRDEVKFNYKSWQHERSRWLHKRVALFIWLFFARLLGKNQFSRFKLNPLIESGALPCSRRPLKCIDWCLTQRSPWGRG